MANTTNLNLVKPAGTDKALVSVINANSDKIDAFAGTTNQAITNINNKMRVISTGSLHDIRTAGIYWLTSAVADKPEPGAGIYVLNTYGNDYISGTYTVADTHKMYTIGLSGGTWTYTELALKSDLSKRVILGSTNASVSGIMAGFVNFTISNIENYNLIKLIYSYYTAGNPEYGSIVVSKNELKAITSEGIFVYAYNINKSFQVRYVNATTLSAKFITSAGGSANDCLVVMAIM